MNLRTMTFDQLLGALFIVGSVLFCIGGFIMHIDDKRAVDKNYHWVGNTWLWDVGMVICAIGFIAVIACFGAAGMSQE